MTAAIKNRNTPERTGFRRGYSVGAAAHCFAGAIAVMNAAGYVVPATTATGLIALGRFAAEVDNSNGANGDLAVEVERGIFRFANSASTDEIAITDVGSLCYLVDDQTVALTDGTGTRSQAGVIDHVDSSGVWVRLGEHALMGYDAKLERVKIQNDATVHAAGGALATSGINLITGGTGIADFTLAAPVPGDRCEIRIDSLSSGDVVVTTAAGVTFDGSNNTATLNAAAEALVLAYKSATEWQVVENVGAVALSAV